MKKAEGPYYMSMVFALVFIIVWAIVGRFLDISDDTFFIVFAILFGGGIAGIRD